jgi:hypothetical protein
MATATFSLRSSSTWVSPSKGGKPAPPDDEGTTMDDRAKTMLLHPGIAVPGMLGALVVVIELAKSGV